MFWKIFHEHLSVTCLVFTSLYYSITSLDYMTEEILSNRSLHNSFLIQLQSETCSKFQVGIFQPCVHSVLLWFCIATKVIIGAFKVSFLFTFNYPDGFFTFHSKIIFQIKCNVIILMKVFCCFCFVCAVEFCSFALILDVHFYSH